MKDEDLKNMAEHFELPLKEGAWDFVEARIPHYPTKKRRWVLWPFILSGGILLAVVLNFNFSVNNSVTSSEFIRGEESETSIQTSINNEITSYSETQTIAPQTESENLNVEIATPVPKSVFKIEKHTFNKIQSPVRDNSILSASSVSRDLTKNSSVPEPTEFSPALVLDGAEADMSTNIGFTEQLLKAKPFTGFDILYRLYYIRRMHAFHSRLNRGNRLFSAPNFVSLNYGILNSNIHLEPELMKLPKGQGRELNLYLGRTYNKWEMSLGIHYARMHQNTSMGNHHDTTYYQVFKPDFETVLPSEYAGRLHDTSKLYIAGTNHNTAHQEFDILGLSFNVGRTVLTRDKFSMRLNYGANYKLLKRANTFFYDSINKAAVPFSQRDKGIVYRNLMSSRISFSFNYTLTKRLSLEVSPFADIFHKPFIKHYYKADLRNYGWSFGLRYGF